jgi:CYTH domain-containing protein
MEELELTYLLKELPKGFAGAKAKEMVDIYIPASSAHAILRVRKSGDQYEITKKVPASGTDSSRQIETTISLTPEEYAELAQIAGKRVYKTRYYFEENGTHFEIDVFKGELEGLVLVDVEFDSTDAQGRFEMPVWCLVDVTQEKFIAGGMLAGKKYADIETKLAALGYVKFVLP